MSDSPANHSSACLDGLLLVGAGQQQALAELGQQFLDGLDGDALLQEALRRAAASLAVDHCGALEPAGDWLIPRAAIGFDDEVVHQPRIPTRGALTGHVVSSGRPHLVEDLASDTRFADSQLPRAHGVSSGATVIIPGPRRAEEQRERARSRADDAGSVSPSARRVLLAEDNPVNRKVALRILQQAGFAVDAVTNGREAVEALEVRPYGLVLMDIQMPEMDGYQATRTIRAMAGDRRRTPVLAMTTNVMSGDRDLCREAGMDDYISKPVRPEELRGAVSRWLGSEAVRMPA